MMQFYQLQIGSLFVSPFSGTLCVKQADMSHVAGFGVYCFDPPQTDLAGGNGHLYPLHEEVIEAYRPGYKVGVKEIKNRLPYMKDEAKIRHYSGDVTYLLGLVDELQKKILKNRE